MTLPLALEAVEADNETETETECTGFCFTQDPALGYVREETTKKSLVERSAQTISYLGLCKLYIQGYSLGTSYATKYVELQPCNLSPDTHV